MKKSLAIWVCVWLCCATWARADAPRVTYLGGEIQAATAHEVVLQLEIAPVSLESVARTDLLNRAELVRKRPLLELTFKQGVLLRVEDQLTPPDSVEFPGLTDQPNDASLPKFVTVRLKWTHVAVVPAHLGSDSFISRFLPRDMGYVTFVLEEHMPWWWALFRSILIGYEHILPYGLDHILFVLGIYLSARRFQDLFWQVTCFTLAHSVTLGLTISGVIIIGWFWKQFVELGIALSIAGVAFENCLWPRPPGGIRLAIVSGFGLIHGLGFAGQLSQVKWPDNLFYLTLFGANLGIELGQLTVVAVACLVTAWWWRKEWYAERIGIPLSFLVGLYGMLATLDRVSNVYTPQQVVDDLWKWYDHHLDIVALLLALFIIVCLGIGFCLIRLTPNLARWLIEL